MESVESERPSGPIFVGGTGRCGTHVIAALAGRSGRYAQVPAELRVHAAREGLPGFVDGVVSRGRLLRMLRRQWRHRPAWDPATPRGIHRIAPRHRYVAALARLAAAPPGADRLTVSRHLVTRLLDPLASAPGVWIEKSPDNCASAGFLRELFPDLRMVHVVRDGRDVACSFMRVPWAPGDFQAALALWERRLLEAHRGTLRIPQPQVHRVLLEDLALRDRRGSSAALLAFLGIPDTPELRAFFESQLTPDRARVGRWRADLHPSEHRWAHALYVDSLERLRAAGVHPLPAADELTDASTPAPATGLASRQPGQALPSSPIDPWAATTAGNAAA